MSDDEIRVAIAEKMNWVRKESPKGVWFWYELMGKFFLKLDYIQRHTLGVIHTDELTALRAEMKGGK